MLPKSILIGIILTLFSHQMLGNTSISKNEINVEVNTKGEIIHIHTIKKKQTLYSLARFFKISALELMRKNNLKEGDIISLDSKIKVPIDRAHINTSSTSVSSADIPIYYQVKKKETLYTIAKKYFGQTVEGLIARNKLSSFAINEGQNLIIGWWNPESSLPDPAITESGDITEISQEATEVREEPESVVLLEKEIDDKSIVVEKKKLVSSEEYNSRKFKPLSFSASRLRLNSKRTISLDLIPVKISELKSDLIEIELRELVYQKRALAFWDKQGDEEGEFWAFHKSAPINTLIYIKNPLTEEQATVRVVGNIDRTLYADDIDIIITKSVAKHLQAHDTRFSVEINYYE